MALSKITAASITDNSITNTQINSSAAIAQSKMAALTSSIMPNGTTVQTSHATGTDFVGNQNGITISAGAYTKILEKSFTFKTTNPFIYLSTRFGLGTINTATDADLALGFGYKTGSGTNSISDYSAFGGNSYTRQNVNPLSSFYVADTYGSSANYGQYWCETKSATYLQQVNQAAGTAVVFAVWSSAQTNDHYVHRPSSHTSNDAGELGGLTVMEIKS